MQRVIWGQLIEGHLIKFDETFTEELQCDEMRQGLGFKFLLHWSGPIAILSPQVLLFSPCGYCSPHPMAIVVLAPGLILP